MTHFVNEALFSHYANEALHAGISRTELIELVGPTILTENPSTTSRVYAENLEPLFKVLYDIKYQERHELRRMKASFLNSENDINFAYLGNAPDLHAALRGYIDICQLYTSNLGFNIDVCSGTATIHIHNNDRKYGFYSPQGFYVALIMMLQKIFELSEHEQGYIISGFTQERTPDPSGFSEITNSKIKTKEDSNYIQFPSSFLEIKNRNYNPLINAYLTNQYNKYYGIIENSDKFLATISSLLSASWTQGDISSNIDCIANKLGMSRSKLYRELTRRNITFSSIIESQRKHYAMTHIQNRDISIADISDRLGYANVSAFTRAFNRWFNISPSKMRK